MPQPRDRAPVSAIVDRPPLKQPGAARLIAWPIVNLKASTAPTKASSS